MNFLWVILEIQSKFTYLIIVSHYAFDSIIYSNFEQVFFLFFLFFSSKNHRVKILQSPLRCHYVSLSLSLFFFLLSFPLVLFIYFILLLLFFYWAANQSHVDPHVSHSIVLKGKKMGPYDRLVIFLYSKRNIFLMVGQ